MEDWEHPGDRFESATINCIACGKRGASREITGGGSWVSIPDGWLCRNQHDEIGFACSMTCAIDADERNL